MPELSVIVTVYNLEEFILDCLDSIRKQTYENYEVIIVNDGSTDRSNELISKYIESEPKFTLYNIENGGVSNARNFALEKCHGRYVMFIDGDDKITKDCFSEAISSIVDNDILVFNYFKLIQKRCVENVDYDLAKLNSSNINQLSIEAIEVEPNPWGKLYRREVFKNITYPAGLYYEDYAVFFKLFLNKKVKFINNRLYYYRIRHGSIMRTFNEKIITDKFDVFAIIEREITTARLSGMDKSIINSYLFHVVFVTLNMIVNSAHDKVSRVKAFNLLLDSNINSCKKIAFQSSLSFGVKSFLLLNKISPHLLVLSKKIISRMK